MESPFSPTKSTAIHFTSRLGKGLLNDFKCLPRRSLNRQSFIGVHSMTYSIDHLFLRKFWWGRTSLQVRPLSNTKQIFHTLAAIPSSRNDIASFQSLVTLHSLSEHVTSALHNDFRATLAHYPRNYRSPYISLLLPTHLAQPHYHFPTFSFR